MKENYFKFTVGQMAYYMEGKGKSVVVLHGWGQNFLSFKNIVDKLAKDYQVIGVDFLGFGLSDEPSDPLSVCDYAFHLKTLLEYLKITAPSIIAHSFGGRVAINYASSTMVDKLILVSSAGIKNRSFKKFYKVHKYKFLKRFFKLFNKKKYESLIKSSGSTDYINSSGVMKKTLSNVVNYSSENDLKKIKAKTYLLWGIRDDQTKYADALKMQKLVKDSKIIPFYDSGHFCYIEEEAKFIREVKLILEEK